ncbi:hypothetical protein QAD02_012671 [Eretmocerus hayati]|uniref:Uncharacterized protein n=1 Tax=Eretmocerus hayati TaxID=131215 RepID=A0ACC2P033_9HYME|nr:hypothetical protein QAD02_012671 [Eretmocerus hayati]
MEISEAYREGFWKLLESPLGGTVQQHIKNLFKMMGIDHRDNLKNLVEMHGFGPDQFIEYVRSEACGERVKTDCEMQRARNGPADTAEGEENGHPDPEASNYFGRDTRENFHLSPGEIGVLKKILHLVTDESEDREISEIKWSSLDKKKSKKITRILLDQILIKINLLRKMRHFVNHEKQGYGSKKQRTDETPLVEPIAEVIERESGISGLPMESDGTQAEITTQSTENHAAPGNISCAGLITPSRRSVITQLPQAASRLRSSVGQNRSLVGRVDNGGMTDEDDNSDDSSNQVSHDIQNTLGCQRIRPTSSKSLEFASL